MAVERSVPNRGLQGFAALAAVLCAIGLLAAGETGSTPGRTRDASKPPLAGPSPSGAKYTTETVRGRVVWLDEALGRLYGVATDPAASETVVALESPDGRLLPIIPDVRGRAFAVDARLRNVDLELLVRRYAGVPMIQTIRVFRRKPDGLYEIDYWCDICAISMFILKPCECCQGPTRLREQLVEKPVLDGKP
ncbi:MAG TPA: hypothetical protein VGZ26_11845 [Pirellulales bacterium]|jgi:hypothetical protein|nr:hypothetical protein [Pirellulales bacterium]